MTNETVQPEANGRPEHLPGGYWSTLSEYDRDAEYVSQLGEEFHPGAKPERFFEVNGDEDALISPVSRRTFLKFSGFAAVAAAVAGCERPVQKILPYVNKPEEIQLGTANYYASTCTECAAACGLLVKTREGRPIKLEGNPEHPMNKGTLCTRGQASILNLYNPDRLKFPVRVGRAGKQQADPGLKMAKLDAEIGERIRMASGKVVLLTPTVTGPANERLIGEFLSSGRNFVHVIYDPLQSGEEREAYRAAFGEEISPRYRWERADVVLCLGGDPLGQSASPTETQRTFAAKRLPTAEGGMSRVYAFEPAPTLTGMNADYRYAVRPDALVRVGLAIAARVRELLAESGKGTDLVTNAEVASMLSGAAGAAMDAGVAEKEIERVAKSLAENAGRGIVYTWGAAAQTQNSMSLHLVGLLLNGMLGNYSETIDIDVSTSKQSLGSVKAISRLIEEMKGGGVEVLLVQGVNPVYTLPASSGFAEALAKVGLVVSLNAKMDETTALADVAIPAVHGLEGWGDAEPQAGLFSLQQPVINVIYGSLSADSLHATRAWQESLISFLTAAGKKTFMRAPTPSEVRLMMEDAGTTDSLTLDPVKLQPYQMSWYQYIRETWREQFYEKGSFAAPTFEEFWNSLVQLGVLDTVGEERRNGRVRAGKPDAKMIAGITAEGGDTAGLVLVAQPSNFHGDGESMGNPFLLELSDPVSKVCWDNYASVAPSRAAELRVKDGDHVTLQAGGASVDIPVYIQPGIHKDVVMVHTGWGRQTFGGIGDGVGANIHPLLGTKTQGVVSSGLAVTMKAASGHTRLANIQGHNYLFSPPHAGVMVNEQHGHIPENAQLNEIGKPVYDRAIFAETTLAEWRKDPSHAYPNHLGQDKEIAQNMWLTRHKYAGHHWGLAVDLNACNGCGACVVACSVENNVPVVGKAEVLKGREMHWIRIDRYYRGDKENPDFASMPLMCQHCDNAPCETVCPVIATMHNDEGINVMTYNRCVGTRYCANNCPYKVRRFNFFQYSDYRIGRQDGRKRVSPLEMVLNPDVTTRSKGVMEKCTFCIQRIRSAKDAARDTGEPLKDGQMLTACQQTCPAKAITFGDRNDPNAEVTRKWPDPRGYGLLADLNTDPSVRYMALVRNRDEASPYRTAAQSHRIDHGGGHGESHEKAGQGAEHHGAAAETH